MGVRCTEDQAEAPKAAEHEEPKRRLSSGVDYQSEEADERNPLGRNRIMFGALLHYWSTLVCICMFGSCVLGLVCFFSIQASMRMCEYSVTEQSRFQPTYSILGATTELIRCRLTMKNFAWNEHWLMFIPYGVLKELFDMMLPVIFGVSLYGEKLNWKPQRKRFFTTILPLITVAFMFLWHAGLGQPGVLRATPVGSAYFSVGTVACYSEVARLLKQMEDGVKINDIWFFFVFGVSILFPTYIYKGIMFPLMFGREIFGTIHIVLRVLIHPMLCEFGMAILRNFARQIPGARRGMAALLFVSLLITRSVFSRFLMIQVKGVGSLVLLQLCLSFLDCIPRITSKESDSSYLQMMYGSRASDVIMVTQRHNDLFVYEQQISMLCEYAALIALPIFLYTANVTMKGDEVFAIQTLIQNCALQLMIQFFFDLVWICYDVMYHHVDHTRVWFRRDKWYLYFLSLIFLAQAFYCLYDSIFGLYCPLGDDETNLPGIRMDKCNSKAELSYSMTLPQYFPLKRFPNYAPGAADPIFNVSDYVLYSKAMNPAVCGGASVLENCMLDHFKTIITMPGRKYGSS